jgi:hypothetical protein
MRITGEDNTTAQGPQECEQLGMFFCREFVPIYPPHASASTRDSARLMSIGWINVMQRIGYIMRSHHALCGALLDDDAAEPVNRGRQAIRIVAPVMRRRGAAAA